MPGAGLRPKPGRGRSDVPARWGRDRGRAEVGGPGPDIGRAGACRAPARARPKPGGGASLGTVRAWAPRGPGGGPGPGAYARAAGA